MKKILFVCARFPWPLQTGDALRAYNQIKELSKRNIVDIFSLEHDDDGRGDIDKYLNISHTANITKMKRIYNSLSHYSKSALQCSMYYDRKSWEILKEMIITNGYDIIIFQLVRLEFLIKNTIILRNNKKLKTKIYCDFVDALSLNMKNRANNESLLLKKICQRESSKLLTIENEIYNNVDASLIISERDAFYINRNFFNIIPNGVELPELYQEKNLVGKEGTINLAFWGNMSYYPNVKAALFLAELYSELDKDKFNVHIIGANPHKKVRNLNSQQGIEVYGFVDDINKLLIDMDIAIFPIFDGSGLQNKVLEAFALQMPVITTSNVLEAMPKLRPYAISAESKDDFLKHIESFQPNEKLSESKNKALEVLKTNYVWNLINNIVENV